MANTTWSKSVLGIIAAFVIGPIAASGITATIISKNITAVPLPQSATTTAVKVGNVNLRLPFILKASATGSATIRTTSMTGKPGTKYPSICVAQPLNNVGFGSGGTIGNATPGRNSGSFLVLTYHVVKNYRAVGGDLGFVRDCTTDGTGSTILDDVCTATGCTSKFVISGNNGDWSGDLKLKLGLRADPGTSSTFEAYVTGEEMDIIGE